MAMEDVNGSAVRARVDELGDRFVTKDVSEDPEVRRRHGTFADHRNYHAQIGRWLSEHSSSLGIVKTDVSTSRGMRWEKTGARRHLREIVAAASKARVTADETEADAGHPGEVAASVLPAAIDRFGPQYSGDNPFTARMRFHQSWWRAEVLEVPFGTGPRRTSTSRYGNMLEADAAETGRNFLTPAIHDVARRRIDGAAGVEPFRCRHNLLSSQPMCFNLFAPLAVMDSALATMCVGSLLPDPAECTRVERTVIEYAPSPRAEYLDDRTAFDAFIEYERPNGTLGFVAIETKLTEPFSQNTDHAAKYVELARKFPDVWVPEDLEALVDARWFQLWRNHLLTKRLLTHPDSPYTSGLELVVHHPLDQSCVDAVVGYRALVQDPDREVRALTIEDITERWAPLVADTEHEGWLHDVRRRYVDLSGSEAAWRDRRIKGLPNR